MKRNAIRLAAAAMVVAFGAVPVAASAAVDSVSPVESVARFPRADDGGLLDEPVDVQLSQPVSDDGRLVAFNTSSSTVVPDDTNAAVDGFVWHVDDATAERVTTDGSGMETTDGAAVMSVSGSGRWVALQSPTDQLVSGDTNGLFDVFVKDLESGAVERVSVRSDGSEASTGDIGSYRPLISGDGRFVAFLSDASDLVEGDTNDATDVFLHDRQTGQTSRVAVDASLHGLSSDGQRLLVRVTAASLGIRSSRLVYLVRSLDGSADVLVNVSGGAALSAGNVAFSGDGSTVTYTEANAVYVFDVETRRRTPITRSVTDGTTVFPSATRETSLSHDGMRVVYSTTADNLVDNDTNGAFDVFLYDREFEITTIISVTADGVPADDDSLYPIISGDGTTVIFESAAGNLIPGPRLEPSDRYVVRLSPTCQGIPATIVGTGIIAGTSGNDIIVGSAGPDTIAAGAGDDLLCGLDGDDTLRGDDGNDIIDPGDGNDVMIGGVGDDIFYDRPGHDTFRGSPGIDHVDFSITGGGVFVKLDDIANDGPTGAADNVTTSIEIVTGTDHRDILIAGPLPATFHGGAGDDTLRGGPGDDTLHGSFGDDVIRAGPGDDTVHGGYGDDLLRGDSGSDTLHGNDGSDRLIGGPGNDTLDGGPDNDLCRGSAGADTYFSCETAQP